MKRIMFLFFAIGLAASTTVMAAMSTGKVRKETRFLTDKMAYELNLSTPQYNDVYEINYNFVYSLRDVMGYVADGQEWALDLYYEALDIRNDDLRWVLSEGQYYRFLRADYFYRPIYFDNNRWSLRVYINYPNRSLFYFGTPYHYRTYAGAHCRPYMDRVSYYRGRYDFGHYHAPYLIREQRAYQAYRRSDFGSIRFRENSSVRPHNANVRVRGIATNSGRRGNSDFGSDSRRESTRSSSGSDISRGNARSSRSSDFGGSSSRRESTRSSSSGDVSRSNSSRSSRSESSTPSGERRSSSKDSGGSRSSSRR